MDRNQALRESTLTFKEMLATLRRGLEVSHARLEHSRGASAHITAFLRDAYDRADALFTDENPADPQ